MKWWLSMIGVFFCHVGLGQIQIEGYVYDSKDRPITYANVFTKEGLTGTTTNELGYFSFVVDSRDSITIAIRSLGYKPFEKIIALPLSESIICYLKSGEMQLEQVVITAGAFEASDEKKGTILKPLDIVTNAGASGDLYGALQTLPGVAPTLSETGIFVRGGEAYETQTYIDGTRVARPFFSDVPNIPARGRFDPFLFKGTLFSTGGYSAEYGQALSSVLLLDTQDFPDQDNTGISLNLAGADVSHTHIWKDQTALLANVGFTHLYPLFTLVPQNPEWITPPHGINVSLGARHKTRSGLFKSYLQYQGGSFKLLLDNLDEINNPHRFHNQNRNLFWNAHYQGILNDKWSVKSAVALNMDWDRDRFNDILLTDTQLGLQSRLTLGRDLSPNIYLKMGTEVNWGNFGFEGDVPGQIFSQVVSGPLIALYGEADIQLGDPLALRAGIRTEYAGILEEMNIAPRLSLAWKTQPYGQLSIAYGHFYQNPLPDFTRFTSTLTFEEAQHYILSYQWIKNDRTLRIEGYHKQYESLVKEQATFAYDNTGFGTSSGIDFFWRDQRSIEGLDYWITYSYLDAERLYRDYPSSATPPFAPTHTLNALANYEIYAWDVQLGLAYVYSSGRTFRNPNSAEFLSDRTRAYHNLNFNISYLTAIWSNFSVLYASVGNPFGFKQIFGYTYSSDGTVSSPILPGSNRQFFLGVFMSIR